MPVPRSTDLELPKHKPTGEAIVWGRKTMEGLRGSIRTTIPLLNSLVRDSALNHPEGPARNLISMWYVPAGKGADEAAGIDVTSEFLGSRAFTQGQYYARICAEDDDDDPTYFVCDASSGASSGASSEVTAQMVQSRIVEDVAHLNSVYKTDLLAERDERMRLRRELEKREEELAEANREIAQLESELAASQENEADIVAPEYAERVLGFIETFAQMSAGSDDTLCTLYNGVIELMVTITKDARIMGGIVQRHPEAWGKFQAIFNATSGVVHNATRLPDIRKIKGLLPPSVLGNAAPKRRVVPAPAPVRKPTRKPTNGVRATARG